MDTYSAAEVARRLDTSVPRVQRAVARLGLSARRGVGGRLRLTIDDLARLESELGRTPQAPGLSRTQTAALAALARAPLGVLSIRALAGRARLSPTAASAAVRALLDAGLIIRERRTLPLGRAREVDVLRANVTAPQWPVLAPTLARVVAARSAGAPSVRPKRVPRELSHLFWNTADSQLRVGDSGGYIARRLLSTGDPEGLAWGAHSLSAADWRHAARTRGIAPDRRALALNLAAAAQRG